MAGALLRSGSLSEYHSLGAVGKPVFSAAGQLRIAIRRSTDRKTSDIFAEPKQNDQGDLIDWYAPYSGNVVPWSAATPEERQSAKTELEGARATLAALASKYETDEEANAERKVFGKLLALATRIPSDEHVYLVDGRPVITFWGFHPIDAPPDLDVIGELNVGDEPSREMPFATAPAAAGPLDGPVAPTEGGSEAAPVRRWGPGWLWLLLPLLALLLLFLLLTGLKGCGVDVPMAKWLPELPLGAEAPEVAVDLPELTPVLDSAGAQVVDVAGRPVWITPDGRRLVIDADGTAIPVGPDGAPLPDPEVAVEPDDQPALAEPQAGDTAGDTAGTTPLTDPAADDLETAADGPEVAPPEADTVQPAEPPVSDTDAPADSEATADTPSTAPDARTGVPSAPLSIPEQAARTGDTSFLDGAWRSDAGLTDSSGNPIQLGYDFKDGKGTVKLDRAVGDQRSVCTGPATPVMNDGELVITQGQIRCADGTTFNAPKVVCTMGADGRANCEGANDDGTTFGVDITR